MLSGRWIPTDSTGAERVSKAGLSAGQRHRSVHWKILLAKQCLSLTPVAHIRICTVTIFNGNRFRAVDLGLNMCFEVHTNIIIIILVYIIRSIVAVTSV